MNLLLEKPQSVFVDYKPSSALDVTRALNPAALMRRAFTTSRHSKWHKLSCLQSKRLVPSKLRPRLGCEYCHGVVDDGADVWCKSALRVDERHAERSQCLDVPLHYRI